MNLKRAGKLVGLGLALVLWVLAGGNGEQTGLAQDCTVTLTVGQSIQQAIDGAAAGAVICLPKGEWVENISIIGKALTLRGTGQDKTILKSKEKGKPVILVKSESEIEVTIEALSATEAKLGAPKTYEEDGLLIRGKARVTIRDCTFSANGDEGLEVWGSANVTVRNSTFSANGDAGLAAWDSSKVTVEKSAFLRNKDGLLAGDSASVAVGGSTFSTNSEEGIEVWGSAGVAVDASTFSLNGRNGVAAWDSGRLTVESSKLSENSYGLAAGNSSSVIIRGSQISDNKQYGIDLIGEAKANISSNKIFGNLWGVVQEDGFRGKVEGSGNQIHNNAKGNLYPTYCSAWPKGFGGGC